MNGQGSGDSTRNRTEPQRQLPSSNMGSPPGLLDLVLTYPGRRALLFFETFVEGGPGQSGALDAGGVLDHTLQRREVLHLGELLLADHHGFEVGDLGPCLLAGLASEPL